MIQSSLKAFLSAAYLFDSFLTLSYFLYLKHTKKNARIAIKAYGTNKNMHARINKTLLIY